MPSTIKHVHLILLVACLAVWLVPQMLNTEQSLALVFLGVSIGIAAAVIILACVQFMEHQQLVYGWFAVLAALLSYGALSQETSPIVIGGCGIAAIAFATRFLSLNRYFPAAKRWAYALTAMNIGSVLLVMGFKQVTGTLPSITFFVTVITLLGASILIQAKGVEYIRFSIFGWLAIAIGIFIEPVLYLPGMLLLAVALSEKDEVWQADRTEWVKKEADRQRAVSETLKETNDHQEELLTLVSRNLQTPVHGIISIAESLRQVTAAMPPSGMTDQLGAIISNGRRMSDMIDELRSFPEVKLGSLDLNFRPVRLQTVAEGVLSATRPFIKNPQIQLANNVPANLPSVLADPDRLHQVLLLLLNRLTRKKAGHIEISAEIEGNKIAVMISGAAESGQTEGLEEAECAIVRQLIELHGSELEEETAAESGLRYRFLLTAAEEMASSPSRRIRKRQNKQMRIAIALNDRAATDALSQHAARNGFTSSVVTDGKELLALLDEQSADVVVLSQELPDITAIALCRLIRQRFSILDLPVLIMAEGGSSELIKSALKAGANNCLVHQSDTEELLLRIIPLTELRKKARQLEETNFVLEQRVKERSMALEIANMNLFTLNEETQEVEKSRNEMLSAISHELGTPITLIHSYIQATKAGLIGQGDPRYLDMIHSKLVLLERLTEDLTDLTTYRLGNMSLRFEQLDAGSWLDELMTELRTDIEQSGRAVSFDGVSGSLAGLMLVADRERLDQVFSNIIWNAVKHTSANCGEISVSAIVHTDSRTGAILESTASDGELVVKICDNGPGIPPDVLPHIFNRYFKGDKNTVKKGSGLGLAIAKEIMLAHRGEISAESKVGFGSCFTVALPLKMESRN